MCLAMVTRASFCVSLASSSSWSCSRTALTWLSWLSAWTRGLSSGVGKLFSRTDWLASGVCGLSSGTSLGPSTWAPLDPSAWSSLRSYSNETVSSFFLCVFNAPLKILLAFPTSRGSWKSIQVRWRGRTTTRSSWKRNTGFPPQESCKVSKVWSSPQPLSSKVSALLSFRVTGHQMQKDVEAAPGWPKFSQRKL